MPTTQAQECYNDMDTAEEHQSVLEIERHDEPAELPDYERDTKTKKFCIIGLVLAWVGIACCISLSVYIIATNGSYRIGEGEDSIDVKSCLVREVRITDAIAEALAFLVNIIVTLLIDTMGFIHSTSLRWALYWEGRLEFNTNIRLFNSARKSPAKRWYANAIWTAELILCYASTSQLFIQRTAYDGNQGPFVNGLAVGTLAVGLLGQADIATWSASSLHQIATWSSNPLKNTLALRHHGITHVPGPCIMAVSEKHDATVAKNPRYHQKRLYRSTRAIRYIVVLVWALPVLAITWAILVTLESGAETDAHSWVFNSS